MSQENMEQLRHVYEALNEGADEPLLDLLHPAFVYRTREELPDGGTYRRHDFLRRLAELKQTFREGRFEVDLTSGVPVHIVAARSATTPRPCLALRPPIAAVRRDRRSAGGSADRR